MSVIFFSKCTMKFLLLFVFLLFFYLQLRHDALTFNLNLGSFPLHLFLSLFLFLTPLILSDGIRNAVILPVAIIWIDYLLLKGFFSGELTASIDMAEFKNFHFSFLSVIYNHPFLKGMGLVEYKSYFVYLVDLVERYDFYIVWAGLLGLVILHIMVLPFVFMSFERRKDYIRKNMGCLGYV